jgi:hypothetical protein
VYSTEEDEEDEEREEEDKELEDDKSFVFKKLSSLIILYIKNLKN